MSERPVLFPAVLGAMFRRLQGQDLERERLIHEAIERASGDVHAGVGPARAR